MKLTSRIKKAIAVITVAASLAVTCAVPAFAYTKADIEALVNSLGDTLPDPEWTGDDPNGPGTLSIGSANITNVYQVNQSGYEAVKIKGTTYFVDATTLDSIYNTMNAIKTGAEAAANDKSAESAKNAVNQIADAFSTKADIGEAQVALSGFQRIIATAIGILAYAIIIMLSVFTAVDIAYITIPPFRSLCSDAAQNGGGNSAVSSTAKGGEVKFRFITDEALYAVQTATVESGKSPVTIYVGKRLWAIILVGIAVYLLLSGNIALIMNLALTLVSGIIQMMANLGQSIAA